MDTQYRKNLKAVLTASKDYTDKTKEEIYWHIGDYSISTQADNTTVSTKTVPSGATRCKIKKIYGLTEKFNPSVAYDNASTMTKTMPNVVYDFDVSKVEGVSTKYNQVANITSGSGTDTSSTNVVALTLNDSSDVSVIGHKYLFAINVLVSDNSKLISLRVRRPFLTSETSLLSSKSRYYFIGTATETTSPTMQIVKSTNSATSETYSYDTANVIDLTAIFGSGNEPNDVATAKTSLLALGINVDTNNPYSLGEIHNLELSGLKVEGQNLFDNANTTLNKELLADGTISDNSNYFYSDYIEVDNNSTYNYNLGVAFNTCFYDSNKTFISGYPYSTTFTTPNNAKYIRMSATKARLDTLMICKGTTIPTTYEPYVSQTLPIDLTSIEDSGGNKLFADGSLKGVGNAADELTPYKAIKKINALLIDENTTISWSSQYFSAITVQPYPNLGKTGTSCIYVGNNNVNTCSIDNTGKIYITFTNAYSNYNEMRSSINNMIIQYNLATPIEVSIDWSSTLRGIQGYSNGTITLQNTYNMDTANTITYNSIIKENCCSKIVQSRGGSVVKTINLPTTASDGYSAGSVNNVRDFTTNKRYTNVNKDTLDSYNYTYESSWGAGADFYINSVDTTLMKKPSDNDTAANVMTRSYTNVSRNTMYDNATDMVMSLLTGGAFKFRNNLYTDTTIFKTANTGNPLYYELADASKTETSIDSVDNIIEVQPDDVLSFYDSNDNLVTVPSEITYRIEVERV